MILREVCKEQTILVMARCKDDLGDEVSRKEGQELADRLRIRHFILSVSDRQSTLDMFVHIAKDLHAIPPPPAPKSVSQRAPVDQKGENADSRVGPQGRGSPSASALPQLSRPPKAGAAVQTNKAADESPCDAGGCSEAVQDPGGLQDGSSKGCLPPIGHEGPGFSKPVPALESPQDERSRSTACGSKRHVRLATAESSEEGPGEKPQKKAQEDSSPEEAGEPIDSPFRSVATGVSSWRQLSLGSLSSQGLPTILTHISESKKGMWVDEEEEEPLPSPKAEPEPAPSPNCEAAWQGGAGGQSGLPAPLVISIPPGHGDAKDKGTKGML
eukprot:g11154.t1